MTPQRQTLRRGFTLIELLVVITIIATLVALLLPALRQSTASARSAVCMSNLRQLGIGLGLYVDDYQRYPLDQTWDTNTSPWATRSTWEHDLLPYFHGSGNLFTDPNWLERGSGVASVWGSWWREYSRHIQPDAWVGWHNWCYGYNALGIDPGLGLGLLGVVNTSVPESLVRAPADMLAIGDAVPWFQDLWMTTTGFGCPSQSGGVHLQKLSNAVFCDGHVETSSSAWFPKRPGGGLLEPFIFVPDERVKRWNNDNQPHPELW